MPVTTRQMCHRSQIEQFADWSTKHGFKREPEQSKSGEVLRLRFEEEPPLVFYQKASDFHMTTPVVTKDTKHPSVTAQSLMLRWLKSRVASRQLSPSREIGVFKS